MPTIFQQILLRRGTSMEWVAANPVLGAAEFGVEEDTGRFKLGDNEGTEVIADRMLTPLFCLRAGIRHDARAPILPEVLAA